MGYGIGGTRLGVFGVLSFHFFLAASAFAQACLTPATCRELVAVDGASTLPVYRTHSLLGAHPEIERAVLVVHGVLRNADEYFGDTAQAAVLAGVSDDTLVLAPQVKCPVLLLNGTNDQQASAELHLVPLEKELKSVNHAITVKRLPGVNHLFQPPKTEWTLMNGEMMPLFSPVAEETIREWIVGLWSKDVKTNH